MPELPEVETVRGQLEKFLVGHTIESVDVRTPGIFSGDASDLIGAKIKAIRRFGKALVFDLDNGHSVISHIKLTGQFIYRGPNLKHPPTMSKKVFGGVPGVHTHITFSLSGGGKLYYNDIRRFGWVKVSESKKVESEGFVSKLGPEPLKDLDLKKFAEILSSTRRAIKTLLMDQAKLAGVGNIYANDALWLAKVHPVTPANKLGDRKVKALYKAIEKVLKKGLETGGASELAFVTPDGGEGSYQKHFLVYGREGTLCKRCKRGKIEKTKVSGRGTYFCAVCQKYS